MNISFTPTHRTLSRFFLLRSTALKMPGSPEKSAAIFTYTQSCIFYFILIGKPIRPAPKSLTPFSPSPLLPPRHIFYIQLFFLFAFFSLNSNSHHHNIRVTHEKNIVREGNEMEKEGKKSFPVLTWLCADVFAV
jgi:hypothetical protein